MPSRPPSLRTRSRSLPTSPTTPTPNPPFRLVKLGCSVGLAQTLDHAIRSAQWPRTRPANGIKHATPRRSNSGVDLSRRMQRAVSPRPVARSGRSRASETQGSARLTMMLAALLVLVSDVGGRTSKGEAELERCLMPLEILEIEGNRIVNRSARDLDVPCKQYPRALRQLGIYCWPNKKAVAREVVEA